jgi:hypothetical protein
MFWSGDLAKIDEWSGLDTLEKFRQQKIIKRTKLGKNIHWKGTKDKYNIIVGGKGGLNVGYIKSDLYDKWTMHPAFKWKRTSYNRHVIVNNKYFNFAECGRTLVELWVVS